MGATAAENATYVLIEHQPDDGVVRASFTWRPVLANEQEVAVDTYTIGIGKVASIELDKSVVARPIGVTVQEAGMETGTALLTRYIGTSLVERIKQASSVGFEAMEITLSPESRLAIAQLQFDDPSTPPALRRGCKAKLDASHHIDNTVQPQ
ncbi:MAG: hypothetical protein JWN82_13 [Candidatus Saccharibacteria bacterium]|nr:hypothetical protein [Candidatus Saccharibacteria bacterium]